MFSVLFLTWVILTISIFSPSCQGLVRCFILFKETTFGLIDFFFFLFMYVFSIFLILLFYYFLASTFFRCNKLYFFPS